MPRLTLETWILIQVLLDAALIAGLAVFFIKIKRMTEPAAKARAQMDQSIERFIAESEKIGQQFTANLLEKKELSQALATKLEARIIELRRLLDQAENSLASARTKTRPPAQAPRLNPAAPEARALVLKMAGQGCGVEEIAARCRLNRGEVELIMALARQAGA